MSKYAFDPSGRLPANLIASEAHSVVTGNGVNHFAIVPLEGPFHGDSLVIVAPNGQPLVPNTDYNLSNHWRQASDAIGHDIYGSAYLTNRNPMVGTYYIRYQSIGGDYVDMPANAIVSGYYDLSANITVDWSTAPTTFPPTPHSERLSGIEGVGEILGAIDRLRGAVESRPTEIHLDDIVDFGTITNPLIVKLRELVDIMRTRNENVEPASTQELQDVTSQLHTANQGLTQGAIQLRTDMDLLRARVEAVANSLVVTYYSPDLAHMNARTNILNNHTVMVGDYDGNGNWAIYRYVSGSPQNNYVRLLTKQEILATGIPVATPQTSGLVQLADPTHLGRDDGGVTSTRVPTLGNLHWILGNDPYYTPGPGKRGLARKASDNEVSTLADVNAYITPRQMRDRLTSSTTRKGLVTLADINDLRNRVIDKVPTARELSSYFMTLLGLTVDNWTSAEIGDVGDESLVPSTSSFKVAVKKIVQKLSALTTVVGEHSQAIDRKVDKEIAQVKIAGRTIKGEWPGDINVSSNHGDFYSFDIHLSVTPTNNPTGLRIVVSSSVADNLDMTSIIMEYDNGTPTAHRQINRAVATAHTLFNGSFTLGPHVIHARGTIKLVNAAGTTTLSLRQTSGGSLMNDVAGHITLTPINT